MRVSYHDVHEREKQVRPDERRFKGGGEGCKHYSHMTEENEISEDGARHIISEGEIARQRYHSELENAVRHIKKQHHNAEEMAQQF